MRDRLLFFVYFQVNNGVVYLDGPLLCSFQLLYWICLYYLMMYCFVFPFVGVPAWRLTVNVSVQYDGGFLPM